MSERIEENREIPVNGSTAKTERKQAAAAAAAEAAYLKRTLRDGDLSGAQAILERAVSTRLEAFKANERITGASILTNLVAINKKLDQLLNLCAVNKTEEASND